MATMTFFAARAARTAKSVSNKDANTLIEMVPALIAALVTVLAFNVLL